MLKFVKLDAAVKPEELTGAAYKLKSNTSDATLLAASEALLLANPQLRELKKIPKGTVVLVPDIGGKLPPAKEAASVELPLGQEGLLSSKQIDGLRNAALAGVAAAKQVAADTASLLKSAKTRSLLADVMDDPEKSAREILDAVDLRFESATRRERVVRKVFDRMAADMERMRKL